MAYKTPDYVQESEVSFNSSIIVFIVIVAIILLGFPTELG